jgi:mannosyltransferase
MTERDNSMRNPDGFDQPRKSIKPPWIVVGVVTLAALLRFVNLDQGLWYDEVLSYDISQGGLADIIKSCMSLGTMNLHPPLYHLVLHFWMVLFGHSDVALRSLSALFGTVSVLLMYEVGTELFDRKTGLAAGVLLAISPLAIWSSQEVRPYGLFLLLSLASFLFFIRLLKPGRPHRADFIGYCLASILLVYTHAFGCLAICSQVLYFLIFRKRHASSERAFWFALAVMALASLPWVYSVVSALRTDTGAPLEPRTLTLPVILVDVFLTYWGFMSGVAVLLLAPFCLALFLAGLLRLKKQQVKILVGRPKTSLLLLWTFIPLVAYISIMLVSDFMMRWKNLIEIAPPICLLAVRGMTNVTEMVKTGVGKARVKYSLLGLIVLLCLPQLVGTAIYPQREPWREVADLIERESRPSDAILCPGGYDICLNHYYKGDLEAVTYGYGYEVPPDEGELTALVDRAREGKERLWLIMLQYENTVDAPIKGFLLTRFGSDSEVRLEDFKFITVYLFHF